MNPTLEQFQQQLTYDPATGNFYRRVKNGTKIAGSINYKGYRVVHVMGKTYKAHRVAWLFVHGVWPPEQIDHINGIRDDNRIENLRSVSQWLNAQNIRKPRRNNVSGLLGVHKSATGKFLATVVHNRQIVYSEGFDSKELAHEAYLVAKRSIHPACTI